MTRTLLPRSLGVLASLVALSVPSRARAQGRDPNAAEALFNSAREAMARGDIATACPRFAESHRLDPAPGTLLNLAQCEQKQGKLATSYAHLDEALSKLPKDDFRIPYAREQLAKLKERVPTVTVTLAPDSRGARVMKDDIELREGSFGVPLPIDPGTHLFVTRMEGRADVRERVALREGEHATVTLKASTTSAGAGDTIERQPSTSQRTVAVGSMAIGGAGLVTGIVTGLMFAKAASVYEEHCDRTGCDDVGLSAASRAKTLNVVSPIALGVGVLGVGVGTYLWFSSRGAAPRQAFLGIRPHVSPQLTGIAVRAGF